MLELHPDEEVGAGIFPVPRRMAAFGSVGTLFPGNVRKKLPTPAGDCAGQSGKEARVKKTCCPVVANGQTSPKLPARSALEGTAWLNSVGVRSRRASSEKKKKVLSLLVL